MTFPPPPTPPVIPSPPVHGQPNWDEPLIATVTAQNTAILATWTNLSDTSKALIKRSVTPVTSSGSEIASPTDGQLAFITTSHAYIRYDAGSSAWVPFLTRGDDGLFINSFHGAWSATGYPAGAIVTHLGSSWMAGASATSDEIPGTDNVWVLIAASGSPGTNGSTVLNGSSNPGSGVGNTGDFYINTTSNTIFGPKSGGVWPTGVSIVGPAGATGATGATGPGVPAGGATGSFLKKTSGGDYVTAFAAIAESDVTNLVSDLAAKIPTSQKGAASGVATLDSGSRLPTGQLPSGVPTGLDAPAPSAVGDTNAAGASSSAARADHVHGREAFGSAVAQTSFGLSASDGSAASVAHSDHTHGTPAAPTPASVGAAQQLVPTAVKTANYTASAGDLVPVSTLGGAVTITLPNAPADKTVVGVKHVIQGSTNAVTVNAAGSDVFNNSGGATSLSLPLLAQGVLLQYRSTGAIWYVVSNDLPLSQTDTRYRLASALVPGITAYYNVKAAPYGAVGDGVTHDDAAINAALTAANAAGGGVVYLPAGTYATAASIVIPGDNIILRGDGKGATIIKPISGATFDAVSTPIPGSSGTAGYAHYYIGVESLEIDCSNMTSNVAGAGNGIHWYGIRWSHIRDVYVNAAKNWSILLDGDNSPNFSYNNLIENCLFNNGAAGIMQVASEANVYAYNNFSQANSALAAAQPVFSSPDTVAMHLRLSGGYATVIGNVFGKSGTYTTEAIRISNSGPNRIIGNRFDQCRYQAINCQSGNTLIEGNQIGNAGSANAGSPAIQLGASNTSIIGNIFDTSNGAAQYTYCVREPGGPYSGNIISNNNFTAGTSGVISQNAGSTNKIANNIGYNPVGPLGPPSVPSSTTAYTNKYGVDATVFVTGGTVTVVAIGGTTTGATSGPFRVPAGQTITLTYSSAPTWTWFGD